ncbi:MAG: hypothetical protein ACYCR4_05605 [Acidimicrobiales bacterium]
MPRRSRVRQTITGLATLVPAVLLAGALGSASAAAARQAPSSPFANPSYNIATPPLALGTGSCTGEEVGGVVGGCASPCYPSVRIQPNGDWLFPLADTRACTELALAAINAAQAAEHLPPVVLPANYYSLDVSEQLFVLANLERVTRGIPPLVGLVPYLDDVATLGARADEDPFLAHLDYNAHYGDWQSGPIVMANHLEGGTSIWDGGDSTPASAMFGWMYDDGWGGSVKATTNFDCTSAHASGCWGHRDAILGAGLGPGCTTCVAGAGYASGVPPTSWTTSYAMIFVDPVNSPKMSFTWNANVLPWLTERYERVPAASLTTRDPIPG